MAHVVEKSIKIYNVEDGNYIYIGSDTDGMDLIEITCSEDDLLPMDVTKVEALLIGYGGKADNGDANQIG